MASRLLAVCLLMQAWGHLLRGWALPGSPKVQGAGQAFCCLCASAFGALPVSSATPLEEENERGGERRGGCAALRQRKGA